MELNGNPRPLTASVTIQCQAPYVIDCFMFASGGNLTGHCGQCMHNFADKACVSHIPNAVLSKCLGQNTCTIQLTRTSVTVGTTTAALISSPQSVPPNTPIVIGPPSTCGDTVHYRILAHCSGPGSLVGTNTPAPTPSCDNPACCKVPTASQEPRGGSVAWTANNKAYMCGRKKIGPLPISYVIEPGGGITHPLACGGTTVTGNSGTLTVHKGRQHPLHEDVFCRMEPPAVGRRLITDPDVLSPRGSFVVVFVVVLHQHLLPLGITLPLCLLAGDIGEQDLHGVGLLLDELCELFSQPSEVLFGILDLGGKLNL